MQYMVDEEQTPFTCHMCGKANNYTTTECKECHDHEVTQFPPNLRPAKCCQTCDQSYANVNMDTGSVACKKYRITEKNGTEICDDYNMDEIYKEEEEVEMLLLGVPIIINVKNRSIQPKEGEVITAEMMMEWVNKEQQKFEEAEKEDKTNNT